MTSLKRDLQVLNILASHACIHTHTSLYPSLSLKEWLGEKRGAKHSQQHELKMALEVVDKKEEHTCTKIFILNYICTRKYQKVIRNA
jgi:hypothetical protein